MGRLQRKLGLAIDCLRAVELVTADGRQVRASADENADLFWGMRGRRPELRDRRPRSSSTCARSGRRSPAALLHVPGDARPRAWPRASATSPTAPDDATATLGSGRGLADGVPAAMAGEPIACDRRASSGREQAERVLAPLLALGAPRRGRVRGATAPRVAARERRRMAWGHRIYTKSGFLPALPDELVGPLRPPRSPGSPRARTCSRSGPSAAAIGRVPEDATAFAGRSAPFWIGARRLHVGRPARRRRAPRVGRRARSTWRAVRVDRAAT